LRFFFTVVLLLSSLFGDSAVSIFGKPKYEDGFQSFDYVNPEAPKGGDIKMGVRGTFDSLNPFILKGVSADDIHLIYDTLAVKSSDEVDSYYGLLAEDIEIGKEFKKVKFRLRKEAKFHDGVSVTAEDVKFTFELLLSEGSPSYKQFLSPIDKIETLSTQEVVFYFKDGSSKDMPLSISTIEILPKHFWKDKSFKESSTTVPVGSGPYRVSNFKTGNSLKLERVKNYWAKDLPVNRGRFNFNSITYDYYRDETVLFEAFKSLNYHFRLENISKNWVTGYKNLGDKFRVEEIKNSLPQGMQGFFFNTRRDVFSDKRVRKALSLAFDYEWTNRNLFYDQYRRTESYFANSPYSTEFSLPKAGGSYEIRPQLREAMRLLKSAGWRLKDGKLQKDGEAFQFEIVLVSPSFVRVVLPYKRNLSKLGIDMNIRVVEIGQYIKKLKTFNFDMVVFLRGQPLLLGGEQRGFWHSSMRDIEGSQNLAGVNSLEVDKAIKNLENSKSLEELLKAGKELDKALLDGWYAVPHWHIDRFRVAYWSRLKRPKKTPQYDLNFHSWWFE
jgi:microcin C transport system substrate-binding protein